MNSKIELELKENHMELEPVSAQREGWEEKFKLMHQNGDDKPIIDDLFKKTIWKNGNKSVQHCFSEPR